MNHTSALALFELRVAHVNFRAHRQKRRVWVYFEPIFQYSLTLDCFILAFDVHCGFRFVRCARDTVSPGRVCIRTATQPFVAAEVSCSFCEAKCA